MNEWLFFALLALLLVVTEFAGRRMRAAMVESLPPEQRTLSPGQRLKVRLATLGWYAAVGSVTLAYWLGSEVARTMLGGLFVLTAALALVSVVGWFSSRRS
jgi:FtsH-binding integral membrane protein